MSAKKGRPATGPTKTKRSLTIDNEILERSENFLSKRRKKSLSALVEESLEAFLDAVEAASPQIKEDKIVAMSSRAHIMAAAGSPIGAEVMDWEAGDGKKVLVKISGLSMSPLLDDGQVVEMRHKSDARNAHMKKGLIYLVAYDDGYTVKIYNTRPATDAEKGEEWAENGKVKVLQSINPEYPEIVIKQPVEWVAWLDEKLRAQLAAAIHSFGA